MTIVPFSGVTKPLNPVAPLTEERADELASIIEARGYGASIVEVEGGLIIHYYAALDCSIRDGNGAHFCYDILAPEDCPR